MSAEAEAGEILVRIMGQGISEMIRITGQGTVFAGRAAVNLMSFCYAVKAGGSPKEIARNPGGMAIITIPEERLEEFRKAAKAYKLQFFSVNSKDYDQGYLDLCMKAEDVATCQRILEMTEIAAVQATGTTVLDQQALAVRGSQTFEEASEKLKTHTQSIEECFDRITDKDYARDTPYVVCDRLHPENYVIVHPTRDMFNGEAYTKSTYTTFQGGTETGVFDDGRFEGRQKNHWYKVRSSIVDAAGLPEDDMVYFRTTADHKAYLELSMGKAPQRIAQVNVDGGLDSVISDVQANLDAAGVEKKVPADAQRMGTPTAASVNGQGSGTKGQKNTTTMKTTDQEKPATFEEQAEKLKARSQTLDASLNRRTDKDFARDEPYVVCDRLHPENYIMVHPQKAVFKEEEYTRSTYTTFKDGRQTGVFDDGRFEGRTKDYWYKTRGEMAEAAGLPDEGGDMVYFRTADEHKGYLALARDRAPEQEAHVDIPGDQGIGVTGAEKPVTFEEQAEKLKARSQMFDASLNRRTEKDFAKDEPYAICDRKNPMNYILLQPRKAEFNKEEYTKTTYKVYRNGVLVGTFDDGRSNYRDQYYWGELKDQMRSAGGFENDMVYFKDVNSLKEYQALYQNTDTAPEIAEGLSELTKNMFHDVNEGRKQSAEDVPGQAGTIQGMIQPEKNNYSEGGVKEFAAKYKEAHPAPDPELTKAIQNKLAEMRVKQ